MNLDRFVATAYSLIPTPRPQFFHVAGIFLKDRPIAITTNSFSTHPLTLRYNYVPGSKSHAELRACLRGRREDYTGYTIAVLRVDRNGRLNMSEPCSGCADMIKQLNFKRLYYTNERGQWVTKRL